MNSHNSFKVIIAGGGVAGLMMANALERANIDFELLEKREIAPQLGQSIFNLPCTDRVFEQLGIAEQMRDRGIPIGMREHWDNIRSKLMWASDEFIRLAGMQNRPCRFIDRYSHLKILYDGLSPNSKSKCHTHEGIESYTENEHGVVVRTDKGNVIEGSILVGADGAYSSVRWLMAQHVKESDPKTSAILAGGFKTRYICLTCTSHNHFANDPARPFMKDGVIFNTYYSEHKICCLSVVGVKGIMFWAVYIPVEEEIAYPCRKFTQADIDNCMKKWGHLNLGPEFTLNDLMDSILGASLVPMEEGAIAARWNSGSRTVLVGDTVHKATANLGMGGNLCIDDACALVNRIHELLERTKEPSTAELVTVFDGYEKAQRPRADFVRTSSGIFAGYETNSKWYSWIMGLIYPWIPSVMKMQVFSLFDSSAPVLNFLPH